MFTLGRSRFSLALLSLLFVEVAYATGNVGTAVRSGPLTVYVSDNAEITEVKIANRRLSRAVRGSTVLDGCSTRGPVIKSKLAGGGVEFRRQMVQTATGHKVQLTERFIPAAASVRWELELAPGGEPWTTPIQTRLKYPVTSDVKFWTAWSDPEQQEKGWRDPLVSMPVKDLTLWYGAPPFRYTEPLLGFMPFRGDLFSVPLVTFLEPEKDTGLSIVLSPRDTLLDLTLDTTASGDLTFSRLFHRLGGTQPVRFRLDLITHEADWRGALRWMTNEYPDYFKHANALADELAGTGAYSATEVDFDAEKMRRMAFRTNWKASFDFPYMGMFLPPVDDSQVWSRYSYDPPAADPESQPAPNGRTTIGQMADYSRRMRARSFYVLSYFNVTEFGALIRDPAPPRRYQRDEDRWKDANDFLYTRLQDAIVRVPKTMPAEYLKFYPKTVPGGLYYTWGDAVVLDCGEPAYADFLLSQAQRHIDKIPESSGICIDRMDWLRLYNEDRDDGVSWFAGRPARSLLVSWNSLLAKLGPMMHNAGKVIFCNNHDKRLDLLKHTDGLFDEFTYAGAPLNLTAFLTLQKPALGWTSEEKDLRPDPDAFFQKYLHLGVYPMAPFPGNDHSLLPGEWVDKQYLDYGPLLDLMRGKKWVLAPHAAEVTSGRAKVNVFEVPGGYVVPVTFGGDSPEAQVTLRGIQLEITSAEAYHPGRANALPVQLAYQGTQLLMIVPLERGCAMVRLRSGGKKTKP
jgi:hypothetical protein